MASNINMNTQAWTDPKEAIVNLNGLINMVQRLQNNSKNYTSDNTSLVQTTHEENTYDNPDTDERNFSDERRNETQNKRTRNLIDGDTNNVQSPKNQRTQGGFGSNYQHNTNRSIIIRNSNLHRRDDIRINNGMNSNHNQRTTTTNNSTTVFNHYDINEQSISYSIDSHLPPIVIECQPTIRSKEIAIKLVTGFINYIEKDFRKQHPNHKRSSGF
ncbi:unnamed protein product [Adineta ricciae]|uniref:Uncharacterized protein n=1 Tax=Adineta ricciae TaxID=249248 RepID=A0A816BKU0_ADIRI|nr:unnamed protein product [Adineta ricciae]